MRGGLVRSGMVPIFAISFVVVIALLSGNAQAQSIQILHYNPGETITYTGSVESGSTVDIVLSSATSVAVSGGNYQLQLSDISIPDCSITITAHSAQTLTFGGSKYLSTILGQEIWTPEITQGYDPAQSYQYPASSGRYTVRIFGQAAPGANTISIDVYVSQSLPVNGGTYSVSVNTANLPSGIYYLTQNGVVVANIYLGVSAPPTFTYHLHKGWNMISVPLTVADNSVTAFFPENVRTILTDMWYYNCGSWMYFSGTRGYSPKYAHLTNVLSGKGYWVKLALMRPSRSAASRLPVESRQQEAAGL